MCRMGKGSENKKKERKKNETIETAVIRFGNGSNDRGDVGDGICTGKCIGGGGNGSITIENASKGIHYTIYKIFDAKVNAEGTSVAYTKKDISENPYFKKDSAGNITATEDAYEAGSKEQLSEGAIAWIKENGKEVCSETSDGSILKFTGLPYGYYYVTCTLKMAV